MFATVGYDQHSLLRAVREATGDAPLSGCSAEGTISGDDADESNFSVVVMVISSEELWWRNGLARGLSADSRTAGQRVAQSLSSDLSADVVGLFVFPDGTTVNFDEFFAGLEGDLPSDRFIPIWGGGAGDNLALVQTYQYWDDEIASDGVTTGLDRMADHIKQELGGNQPNLLFHFDCCSRGKLMFREQKKMWVLRQFRRAIGSEVPWAGFHTYGEIGPVGKHNCYHNQTAVVLALA
jgi:hypothetical protein